MSYRAWTATNCERACAIKTLTDPVPHFHYIPRLLIYLGVGALHKVWKKCFTTILPRMPTHAVKLLYDLPAYNTTVDNSKIMVRGICADHRCWSPPCRKECNPTFLSAPYECYFFITQFGILLHFLQTSFVEYKCTPLLFVRVMWRDDGVAMRAIIVHVFSSQKELSSQLYIIFLAIVQLLRFIPRIVFRFPAGFFPVSFILSK